MLSNDAKMSLGLLITECKSAFAMPLHSEDCINFVYNNCIKITAIVTEKGTQKEILVCRILFKENIKIINFLIIFIYIRWKIF